MLYIQEFIRQIDAIKGDDERAHSMADNLYRHTLKRIADGADNAKELAAETLKVEEIEFARWYA